jgi:ribosomal protein S14
VLTRLGAVLGSVHVADDRHGSDERQDHRCDESGKPSSFHSAAFLRSACRQQARGSLVLGVRVLTSQMRIVRTPVSTPVVEQHVPETMLLVKITSK